MQDERVGRVGDVYDGEHDRDDGRARLCDAELTGRSLRARTLHFFRIVYLKEMEVAPTRRPLARMSSLFVHPISPETAEIQSPALCRHAFRAPFAVLPHIHDIFIEWLDPNGTALLVPDRGGCLCPGRREQVSTEWRVLT